MLKMTADVRLKASNKDDAYYRYSLHFPYYNCFTYYGYMAFPDLAHFILPDLGHV